MKELSIFEGDSILDIEALREQFIHHEFDRKTFDVTPQAIVVFSRACGEEAPRFTDPSHPDFQAPPTFPSSLIRGPQMPADFPKIEGLSLNAGKAMEVHQPIRPGVLTGCSHLHETYTKTGRSGQMLFLVSRTRFYNANSEPVATADSRQVIREKPTKG